MSETSTTQTQNARDSVANARRALVVGEAADAEALREKLAACGYVVMCVTAGDAARAASKFLPALALFAFGAREGEGELVAAARRLRSTPETFALPFVFLFRTDERTLRDAALNVGADDYFGIETKSAETCARLDALFWRAEVGRRAAPVVADQLTEIDKVLFLLDAVGGDASDGGAPGTIALVGLAGESARAGEGDQERLLAAAHGFLKLNLRRVDAVAFYGPTMLLVYLPRTDARTAQTALSRLRAEFVATRPGADLAVGLASFPSEEDDKVEALVEKAESALAQARSDETRARVAAYPSRAESTPSARRAPAFEALKEEEGAAAKEHRRTGGASETPPRGAAASGVREGERDALAAGAAGRLLLAVSDAARMAQVNLLMRSAGYEVRAAFDGQQALNLLRIERPDLVLVDSALDDMDGLEMLKRFRKQSGGKTRPSVVLMLPAGREGARAEAFEAGARAVVTLPYDPVELLDVVRANGAAE
ncbi:MAG TPA: response regulator [Pyrinomonadaceae bacterium]|nr:response regulator [Pyrinomonadaceae bacterium]